MFDTSLSMHAAGRRCLDRPAAAWLQRSGNSMDDLVDRLESGGRDAEPSRSALPRVVIIGAGFGGLSAAFRLGRVPADITVIDWRNHHLFQRLLTRW